MFLFVGCPHLVACICVCFISFLSDRASQMQKLVWRVLNEFSMLLLFLLFCPLLLLLSGRKSLFWLLNIWQRQSRQSTGRREENKSNKNKTTTQHKKCVSLCVCVLCVCAGE